MPRGAYLRPKQKKAQAAKVRKLPFPEPENQVQKISKFQAMNLKIDWLEKELQVTRESKAKFENSLRAQSSEMAKLRHERELVNNTIVAIGKLLIISYGEI